MAWEGAIAVSAGDDADCIGSSRFLSYKRSGDVDIRYLNYYFQSENGRAAIRSTSTGTVVRNQTLSIKDFEQLVVSLPSHEKQRLVSDLLDTSKMLRQFSLRQDIGASQLRTSLLAAAFSGQL